MSMASERERHRRHLYANMSPDDTLRIWKNITQMAEGKIRADKGAISAARLHFEYAIGSPEQIFKIDVTTDGESLKTPPVAAKPFSDDLFRRLYRERTERSGSGNGSGTAAPHSN